MPKVAAAGVTKAFDRGHKKESLLFRRHRLEITQRKPRSLNILAALNYTCCRFWPGELSPFTWDR